MEIRIIVALVIIVLILVCVVAWLVLGVKTLEEKLDDVERRERRMMSDITGHSSEIDFLKMVVNALKKADIMAERKERMADYLMDHPSDSINDLAGALYDIAYGKIIDWEDKE